MNLGGILFPYENIRDVQKKLLAQSHYAVNHERNLVVHAPTGVGKTAAVLAPALTYAMDNDKVVFFLTSRLTQHQIAIDTLREVKERHNTAINAVDVVGKKWLCLQEGVTELSSGEFAEYCRKMREDQMCEFYENLKNGERLSKQSQRALQELREGGPHVTESIMTSADKHSVCPYEISMLLTKDSHVVVTDYFYLFNPKIREAFLQRMDRELDDAIVIVDEAHNLPDRVKGLPSSSLTNIAVKRAISEAEDELRDELAKGARHVLEVLNHYGERCDDEMYIEKHDFKQKVEQGFPYGELIEDLLEVGGKIREEEQRSYLASLGEFLESWTGDDEGYARIFSREEGSRGPIFTLNYRCLDPGLIARDVWGQAHANVLMSGTLTPADMYAELLGVPDPITSEYDNPFPEKNRLSMIVPKTTTKYSKRSTQQFKNIADVLADIADEIPGNSAVFFPSYALKDKVAKYLTTLTNKTVFEEVRGMSKKDKHDLLEDFKTYKDSGAVLLGVASGSFGEGINLPGDLLKGVVIVGLPLQKPDLEVESLIDYYDEKFGKGWDYGYLYPAFNRTLQSAGRCIRSKNDRGVIVFLDERYAWNNYRRLFPETPRISRDYKREIRDFFQKD
jgi:DNA excision repair protein ERCC-2